MTSPSRTRKFVGVSAAFAIGLVGAVAFATPASAASFTVSTEAELANAITTANANPGLDQITLTAGFTLTAGVQLILDDINIDGAGFTIEAAGNSGFQGIGSDMTLRNITINNTGAAYAFLPNNGNVVLDNVTFDDAPVYIDGSALSITITETKFNNSGWRQGLAINVAGSSVVSIDNSEANGNIQAGIDAELSGASTLVVTNTHALNNSFSGIAVYANSGSTVTMMDSRADTNSQSGFSLEIDGSTGTITRSTATSNGGAGFDTEAYDSATVSLNLLNATSNGGVGVDLSTGLDSDTTAVSVISTLSVGHSLQTDTRNGGRVTLQDSVFSSSTSGLGANLNSHAGARTEFIRVTISDNDLGGVMVADTADPSRNSVSFVESTISDNRESALTGTGDIQRSDIVFERSTISGNSAARGGAIYAVLQNDSSITLLSSTISGNSADVVGGIWLDSSGSAASRLSISHSTIVNNTTDDGPGGIGMLAGQYTVDHSVIAGNIGAGAAWDFDADAGASGAINYSLVQEPTANALTAMGVGTADIINENPQLAPLADNGGTTLTHLPLVGSPLVDAGNAAIVGAPATDQRGLSRIVGTIDIGAVEVQAALAVTGSDASVPLFAGAILLLLAGSVVLLGRRRLALR